MPIAGRKAPPRVLPEFWRTFAEMDNWRATQRGPLYPADGVLKFSPRRMRPADIAGKGKLLVSHDFKGGYVEDPFSKSYSFNWWYSTEVFNYFAHHRITIPPPEWITAAHRQGVPILGTIIFEGGGEEDCLRMVMGKLPQNSLSPSDFTSTKQEYTIPVSSYYAELFADLAVERGFDGWLLNVEISLTGGPEQARGLVAWMALLQQAILRKVGPHGQVHWYDSVTVRGDLWWQDRLNGLNLPYFLNSTGIFTNYWWYTDAPRLQLEFFNRIKPELTGQTLASQQYNFKKTIQDIYIGVDVWGRGSHGGGGFGAFKAIEHADPMGLGFSIALFAQGWTWETEEEKPGWNWRAFWEYDTKLWAGPVGVVEVPEHSIKPGEPPCTHGLFQPISSFFLTFPPPDPLQMPFYTNFCPGIGDAWFVEGKEVYRAEKGWSDFDKQTTVGDLVWPKPKAYHLTSPGSAVPALNAAFNFNDAWNGGNSLQVNCTVPGGATTYGAYWLPLQTFTFTGRRKYDASIVFKPGLAGKTRFDPKFELGIRTVTGESVQATFITQTTTELPLGWQKAHVTFEIETPLEQGENTIVPAAIGFVLAVSNVSSTEQFEFPFLVGQVVLHAHLPAEYTDFIPALLWVVFSQDSGPNASPLDGKLTWDAVAALARPTPFEVTDPNEAVVPWNLQPTRQAWFPKFHYFNVYALELLPGGGHGSMVWIGTTGFDGQKNSFYVYEVNIPGATRTKRFTFQIEGLLETGEHTHWYTSESAVADAAKVEVGEQKRSRRTSLKSAMLSPLRRKKSKGDGSLAK